MRRLATVALLALAVSAARAATIFDGDAVDPGTGRAYAILPGVPLILPQPDGKFDPPIVDPSKIGDVDVVVRAAALGIGPVIPPPVAVPPVATAGGVHVAPGSEIPFTVIASTGGTGVGQPLGGTSLDGIPVVVAAWADLDGDGVVGPTAADGTADDARELQEALFVVGRQVAVFSGGVAEGTLAVWKGAPASAGGLTVALTALAYVGPFRPGFFEGVVPDGPGVATLLPMFPRLDPKRVIEGDGRGGPADPDERLGIELAPAFDVPVGDPVLGTPFALPTDGSSITIDRAVVVGGPVSRARFLRPAALTGYSDQIEADIHPGAGGVLLEPQPPIALIDDGPGGGVTVQLVPVDRLDNVTDPPAGTTATVIAGPGLAIAAPDTDGDPTRETVTLSTAGGAAVTIDDAGGVNDAGTAASAVTVALDGVPVERLAVGLTPGSGGSTTTTLSTSTTQPSSTTLPPSTPPTIRGAALDGQPALPHGCPIQRTLGAVVEGATSVSATIAVNGGSARTLALVQSGLPAGFSLPPGPGWSAPLSLTNPALGVLSITVDAQNAAGAAAPFSFSVPIVTAMPPTVLAPSLATTTVPPGVRPSIAVTARVFDDCPIRRVSLQADLGRGFRSAGTLRDTGRRGDAAAGDGVFTGTLRLRAMPAGTVPVRVTARNKAKRTGTSPTGIVTVQ